MKKELQCKHIPEQPILEFLHDRKLRGQGWAYWYRGSEDSVPMPEGTPEKLIIAKMAQMIRKGIVSGCPCGCRGDYEITEKGIEQMFKSVETY